jgi:nicotinate-nucleotide pyrophosphorylase (carboxylating)
MPLLAQAVDPALMVRPMLDDGTAVAAATAVADVTGLARSILVFERTALNFLQRLSGIATLTRQYVEAAAPAQVFDTRKTTPGWRVLEKYAVRMGGGHNHRMGLFDAVLIKDNHLAALGGGPQAVRDAVAAARALSTALTVEIEVDSVELCEAALAAGPDFILLDNMPLKKLRQCVQRRDAVAPEVKLEASGGVNLDTIAGIAATGVERISVGALTHSAPALDIALDFSASAELGIAG